MHLYSLRCAVNSLTVFFALCGLVRAAEVGNIPCLDRLIETHPVANQYVTGVPTGEIEGRVGERPCFLRVVRFPAGFEEKVPDPNLIAWGNHTGSVLVAKKGYRVALSFHQDEHYRTEFYDLVTSKPRPYAEGGEGNSFFVDTQWATTETRGGVVTLVRSHYGLLPARMPVGWETRLELRADADGNIGAATGMYVSKLRKKVSLRMDATFGTGTEKRRVANYERLHGITPKPE